MEKRPIRGESSKKKIMDVAKTLFTEKGYDATSVQDICENANLSKGAFFHYFQTKESLFMEILDEYLSLIDENMEKIEKSSKNAIFAMERMVKILEDVFITSQGKFTIFLEFLRKSSKNEEVMKRIVEQFKKYEKYLTNLIEKGKREKSIKEEVDSKFISKILISIAIGMILKRSLSLNEDDISKEGIEFILKTIRKESDL